MKPFIRTKRLPLAIAVALLALSVSLLAAVVGSDTFGVDAAGTNLTAHTADVGGGWAKVTGATGDFLITDAARVRLNSVAAGAVYYHAATPASAQYDAQVTFYKATTIAGNYHGLWANLLTSAITGYQLQYEVDAGKWVINQVTNDSYTNIGEYAQALSDATGYVAKLEIRTASQKAYIDGVLRITATDTTHTAVGKCGLSAYASTTAPANTPTGIHYDNFSCTDLSSASTPNRLMLLGVSE